MRVISLALAWLLAAATLVGVLSVAHPVAAATSADILLLGDSITEGTYGDTSYRCDLFEELAGESFDFKGTKSYAGDCGAVGFDADHAGYGGQGVTTGTAACPHSRLQDLVDFTAIAGGFNVVLLHVLTNDKNCVDAAWSTAYLDYIEAEYRDLIADIRTAQPTVTIYMARIIPCDYGAGGSFPGCQVTHADMNQRVVKIASDSSTEASPIILVDQELGFNGDLESPPSDLKTDRVHPNTTGAEKMARNWEVALRTFFASNPLAGSVAVSGNGSIRWSPSDAGFDGRNLTCAIVPGVGSFAYAVVSPDCTSGTFDASEYGPGQYTFRYQATDAGPYSHGGATHYGVVTVTVAPPDPVEATAVDSEVVSIAGTDHVAVLFVDPVSGDSRVDVRDVAAGMLVTSVSFGSSFVGSDLEIMPAAVGDPELVVLGTRADGAVRVTAKDSVTGALVGRANYGGVYSGDDLEILGSDMAVLGARSDTLSVRVQTRTLTDAVLGTAFFGNAYTGIDLEVSGSAVGVLGTKHVNQNVRVRTMSPTTGALVSTAYFGNAFTPIDLETRGADWAVLQERASNGTVRVQTRNPAGSVVGTASFGISVYVPSDLAIVGGNPAVLGISTANQAVHVQTRTMAGVLDGTANYGTGYSGIDLEVVGSNVGVLGIKSGNGKIRDQVRSTTGIVVATVYYN